MKQKLVSIFIIMNLLTLVTTAAALKRRDSISFMSPTTKIMTEGIVKMRSEHNIVFEAKEFVIEEGSATYIVYRNYQSTDKDVGAEVAELNGIKAGMNLCIQDKKVEIERVYSNYTAKIIHGDIFGKRFLLFQRPEIVKISDLHSCE